MKIKVESQRKEQHRIVALASIKGLRALNGQTPAPDGVTRSLRAELARGDERPSLHLMSNLHTRGCSWGPIGQSLRLTQGRLYAATWRGKFAATRSSCGNTISCRRLPSRLTKIDWSKLQLLFGIVRQNEALSGGRVRQWFAKSGKQHCRGFREQSASRSVSASSPFWRQSCFRLALSKPRMKINRR